MSTSEGTAAYAKITEVVTWSDKVKKGAVVSIIVKEGVAIHARATECVPVSMFVSDPGGATVLVSTQGCHRFCL